MEGEVVSEVVGSCGENSVQESAAMKETLSQNFVSMNAHIEVSPSSSLVGVGVVDTVEVALFKTLLDVEQSYGGESSVEETVEEVVQEVVGGGSSVEEMVEEAFDKEAINGESGGESGVEETMEEVVEEVVRMELALDCNRSEKELGRVELTRIHLVHMVDRNQSEVSASDELPKGLTTPHPTSPITTCSTTSSVIISWCLPNRDPGTIFQVEMKLCTAIGWTLVYYGRATSFTMTGLPPGTDVGVRIRAVNLGISGWSCEALCSTLPGPPGAPSALAALNIGSSEIELGWRPPVHDGGPFISGFRLEMNDLRQKGDASATEDESHNRQQTVVTMLCGNDSRFVVKGLDPGATYCFRVQAFNMLRDGPYSESIVLETCPAPPAIPEPPVFVDKTFKSLSLSWPFPLCNGASVESFVLQMVVLGYGEKCLLACDDSHSASPYDVYSGPSNEFIMKKLQPFSSYAFRVKAQNAAGSSEYSAFSTCMTSPGSPDPPPPLTIVETMSSSLTLKWEIPDQDNGSPVFGYSLEMLKVGFNRETPLSERNLNGGQKLGKKKLSKQDATVHLTTRVWEVVYDGHDLRSQITGLSPGNEYKFRVKVQNALGTSSPSSILVARTRPAPPGAPQPPTFIKITPTSVQIKWSSPACDNGMPVTSYKLMLDDGQGGQLRKVYEGEAKLYNASKLVPSSSYRVAVQAINACGASDLSEVAVVELPVAPLSPPAPTTVVVDLPYKERPSAQAATVVGALPNKERPAAPTDSIKSMKEVKELMRQKARPSWSRKLTKFLNVPDTWQIQQPWARRWVYVGAVFVMLLLLKML